MRCPRWGGRGRRVWSAWRLSGWDVLEKDWNMIFYSEVVGLVVSGESGTEQWWVSSSIL